MARRDPAVAAKCHLMSSTPTPKPSPPATTTTIAVTRHLRITGRVQGVWYRASMTEQAKLLGLQGWVRNRHDGSVEALAHGPAHAVQALIDWAHQGPKLARVDGVQVTVVEEGESCSGFVQRETV